MIGDPKHGMVGRLMIFDHRDREQCDKALVVQVTDLTADGFVELFCQPDVSPGVHDLYLRVPLAELLRHTVTIAQPKEKP